MLKKTASIIFASVLALGTVQSGAYAEATDELKDSGINYTETTETIQNPGAGYTTTVWANCAPGETKVYDPEGSLVLFFINIGQFSSGINGTADYDLDETFFDAWRRTFENCRKNGCMIAVRFRYDDKGTADPEPATFQKVLDHVRQIKESNILSDNEDILAFVECGFVGKWGEQHGGKYTDNVQDKAKLLDAVLDAVPESVPVSVRTPDIFAEWAGIDRSQLYDRDIHLLKVPDLDYSKIFSHRVGLYDDGYMGSDTDLGTYKNREIETSWIGDEESVYFGGEFSGNIEYAKEFDTYLPQNAIPEMYKTHLSYINGNIFKLYEDYTFGKEYDVDGVDNSAYYGESVFKFIRDHIGYRFVLRKSEFSPKVKQGGVLDLNFDVENTGFANPIFYPKSYLILEKDGIFYQSKIDIQPHTWSSSEVNKTELEMQLPDCMEEGKWNIYLRLSAIDDQFGSASYDKAPLHPKYGIKFANDGIWNPTYGANYLGSFEITKTDNHVTNNTLYHKYTDMRYNNLPLTFNGFINTDGKRTNEYEWEEKDIIAEKGNDKVYLKADDKNLYIMTEMPDTAKAPVYNIELNNNGEKYWIYFASNGYIYFNHDSYGDSQCKWSGKMAEVMIPFEVMGLKSGGEISSLRVFLQDSSDSWKLLSDITVKNAVIPSDFSVYSASCNMRLKEGSTHDLYVKTDLPDLKFQWYHNNEAIENATDQKFTIENAQQSTVGQYSVRITTAEGIEKTFDIANVLAVTNENDANEKLRGDVNLDGTVDMADVVLIMQSLSNPNKYGVNGSDSSHITAQGIKNGDVYNNRDGITVNDALEIQKYLLGTIKYFE